MKKYLGLTSTEVIALNKQYGLNVLPEKRPDSFLLIFFRQFKSFLVGLLLFAAVISFLLNEILDSVFIVFILFLNAFISFFQEIKAKNEMSALKKMVVSSVRVVRDGKEVKLETKYLLPNDLVVLEAGDRIPADGKIITGKNLLINEASLTGESVPVEKNPGDKVYLATTLLNGKAEMIVELIGADTRFGKLALSLAQIPEEKTPLEIKIAQFSRRLAIVLMFLISTVALIGFIQQRDLPVLFFSSIALAVAAIPEGLPTVLTIALAIGVRRLAKKGAIVKRLVATEALGTIDVICTDKTGTLTKNEMTVKKIVTVDKNIYEVSGVGFNILGEVKKENQLNEKVNENDTLQQILKISALCNNSSLVPVEGNNEFKVLGDTTEGALLILVMKQNLNYQTLREQNEILEELPFDSNRRLMTVITKNEVLCKGAPDKLLAVCDLSDEDQTYFRDLIRTEGEKGYRLLGFASKKYLSHVTEQQLEKNLHFLGIVEIFDPPRDEVKPSIESCKKAGVEVVMITGDSVETGKAIAKQIGLLVEGDEVISGDQLRLYSDEVLGNSLKRIKVFARTTPEDKLRIVEAFQKIGKTVAVTGDGVNDAPALKRAQVGVAMGITGTDVSKEAADLVITDDNFSTIVTAIAEGRLIYLNLLKAIKYLLACNLAEVVLVFWAMVLGFPLPLSPLAILWLNVVTDGLPALALAIDKGDTMTLSSTYQKLGIENNILSKRNLREIFLLGSVLGVLTLMVFIYVLPRGLEQTRITTFTFLVILELVVAFVVRGKGQKLLGNKFLIVVFFVSLLIQFVIIFIAPIRDRFI